MSLRNNLAKIKEGDIIFVEPEKQYVLVTKEETGCMEQCIYGRNIRCNVIEMDGRLFLLSDVFANLKLGGKRGYDNAWDIINRVCKEIYGVAATSIDRRNWEKFRRNNKLKVCENYWIASQSVWPDEWRNFHSIIISSGCGDMQKANLFISDRRISSIQEILESSENICEAGIRFLKEV